MVVGINCAQILPDWILAVCLVVLLSYTAKRTMTKGFKAYAKESEELRRASKQYSALSALHKKEFGDDDESLGVELISKEQKKEELEDGAGTKEETSPDLLRILDREKVTPRRKVITLMDSLHHR